MTIFIYFTESNELLMIQGDDNVVVFGVFGSLFDD